MKKIKRVVRKRGNGHTHKVEVSLAPLDGPSHYWTILLGGLFEGVIPHGLMISSNLR
jgi:hypothetical protein